MARDGIADLTWVNPGYQAGRFPMIAVGELPFLMAKPGGGSAALDAWYRKYAAKRDEGRQAVLHPPARHAALQEAHHRARPDQGHEDAPGQRHGGRW
jgi:hypothetical protein